MYERNIRSWADYLEQDGARGVAITELTCEMAMQIGRAAASGTDKRGKAPGEDLHRKGHPYLLGYSGGSPLRRNLFCRGRGGRSWA